MMKTANHKWHTVLILYPAEGKNILVFVPLVFIFNLDGEQKHVCVCDLKKKLLLFFSVILGSVKNDGD